MPSKIPKKLKPTQSTGLALGAIIGSGVLLLGLLVGCGKSSRESEKSPSNANRNAKTAENKPSTVARFLDRTKDSGVVFTYRNGEEAGHVSILESLGGGVGLLDFDGDGRFDLLASGGGGFGPGQKISGLPSALFRNKGSWKFEQVNRDAFCTEATYYSHGVSVGDFNNDGFADALITGYGGLLLFVNNGDGTFSESARSAGLTDDSWSSSAAWGDFDNDGNLDLYVAHYVNWSWKYHPFCKGPTPKQREICPPRDFVGLSDTIYFSNGDGTFRDGTSAAGLKPKGNGLGVVVADLNVDGLLDIYVGNDNVENFLYQNLGNGKFKEIGLSSGTSMSPSATPEGSMGVDVGDYNGDGLPDIWVANYERENFALYRNDGNFSFTHVSQSHGVAALGGLYVGWGTVFFDMDRDGDEDVFVSNGHVIRFPNNSPLRQKPILLENRNGKRFFNVAAEVGGYFESPHMGRGAAVGDLDDDGDLDLVVSHTNEPISLISNETRPTGGWLSVRLIGTESSRDPVGAIVELQTDRGKQIRLQKSGSSYASSSDPRLFFGLGAAIPERLMIRWPSGIRQFVKIPEAGRVLTIIEQRSQPSK